MSAILLTFVALVGFWIFGGIALRSLGIIAFAAGALQALAGQAAGTLVLIPAGFAMWLAGHRHFGIRHHGFKSPTAERILTRRLPRGA
jgi:hypothetical protein